MSVRDFGGQPGRGDFLWFRHENAPSRATVSHKEHEELTFNQSVIGSILTGLTAATAEYSQLTKSAVLRRFIARLLVAA